MKYVRYVVSINPFQKQEVRNDDCYSYIYFIFNLLIMWYAERDRQINTVAGQGLKEIIPIQILLFWLGVPLMVVLFINDLLR